MFFGKQPLGKTSGAIIAHSIRLKHKTLKKGHVITDEDIEDLKSEGYKSIMVARLEQGDIDENKAAKSLAQALVVENLVLDKPFTGRCNIRSDVHGLIKINQEGIDRINNVHESITIATLQHFSIINPGEMIATVKIIPFAVEQEHLQACLTVVSQCQPVLQVSPLIPKRVGFIQTRLTGTRENILDKTTDVTEQRLKKLQCTIVKEIRVDHVEDDLVKAIDELLDSDIDILMIMGASAIVDRRDIIPAAIEKTGGEVIHFGMPTDPGNLLLFARHEEMPVLGLPGCARSPKRNGLDLVLERLAASVAVTSADIMEMGQGGLLKEIRSRPQPRESEE